MGRILAFALCLLSPLLAIAQTAAAPNKAGSVDFVEGDVKFYKPDKSAISPAVGDPIYELDSVVTGADGEVHFKMEDGGLLAVRPNTRMRIAKFQANGDAGDKSILGILEGGLRSISGWIAKYNPSGYQIRARSATIGIRGTDHETHVRARDDAEGEAGVYDRVYEGATFIRTDQGRVDVTPNRVGFHPAKAGARPRLLDKVPAFFRPTRNERRLEGMHKRLQPLLEKHRGDRQARLKQLRQESGKKAAGPKKLDEEKRRQEAAKKRHELQEKAKQAREEKAKQLKENAEHKAKKADAKAQGKAPTDEKDRPGK
jgi:hypothetical protein